MEGVNPVARGRRRGVRRGWAVVLGSLLVYFLCGAWVWHLLLPGHWTSKALAGGALDPSIFIWWLNWTPYALVHGLDPLSSRYLLAPHGVSAIQNTSVLSLGVLFAPVTWLFGPIASYNLACILGPALSAWAASFWLRRHYRPLPAFIGGLVFGFNPFVIDHCRGGDLNLIWLGVVPLIAMQVEDLLWRSRRPWWPHAPLLGLLVAIQFFISPEVLIITGLGCLLLCVLVAVFHPKTARQRLPAFALAAAVALVVAAALCAWPIHQELTFGGGFGYFPAVTGHYVGNAAMLVNPPNTLVFHTTASSLIAHDGAKLTIIENGLYIGIPLLALITAISALRWRSSKVWIALAVAAASLAVQTGWPTGLGASHGTLLRLLQDNVHALGELVPARFAILMWLCVALLVGELMQTVAVPLRRPRGALGAAAVLVCLLPLVPNSERFIVPVVSTPRFFTSTAVKTIPPGAVVMIAPMATVHDTDAMIWQIKSGMRFAQIGGYALHPGTDGHPRNTPYAQALTTLFRLSPPMDHPFGGKLTPKLLNQARAELRQAQASYFILGDTRQPVFQVQVLIAIRLIGHEPNETGGGGRHLGPPLGQVGLLRPAGTWVSVPGSQPSRPV